MHFNWTSEPAGEALFTDVFSSNVRVRSSCLHQPLFAGKWCSTTPVALYQQLCQKNWLPAIAWFDLKRTAIKPFSENIRLLVDGRDLCMSSGPTPSFKQVHLEPPVQDYPWIAFQYLQGRKIYNLSVHLVPAVIFKKVVASLITLEFCQYIFWDRKWKYRGKMCG